MYVGLFLIIECMHFINKYKNTSKRMPFLVKYLFTINFIYNNQESKKTGPTTQMNKINKYYKL